MEKKNVLITGGAGFIGSHLINALLDDNDIGKIYLIDNLDTGNLSKLDKIPEKLQVYILDLRNDITYDILSKLNFNIVVHLAAISSVERTQNNFDKTVETNFLSTVKLAKLAIAKKARFIFASSAAIYGKQKNYPLKEEFLANPISFYGLDKLYCENYLKQISNDYGLDVVVLRFFNVYGKNQNKDYAGVISKFMDNLKKDLPVVIYGDGTQTRDFIFVEDIVNIIKKFINMNLNEKYEIFNLGTGKETKIIDLANLIYSIMNKGKPRIIFKEAKKFDIKRSVADISKLKKIGIELKYDIKSGLRKMIKDG